VNKDEADCDLTLKRLKSDPSDADAWATLYKQHWAFVFAVAYRRCRGAREMAEDVAQEVFVRLLHARPFARLQDSSALRGYLFVTAQNTAAKRMSQFLSRNEAPLAETFDLPDSSSIEERTVIESARQRLSLVDQQILSLVVSGMGLREIAEKVGLSYANTAVRLHRLRKQLRGFLKVGP
jgi:RNA polymerase sigma factor (sigma-70 family)